MSTILYIEDDPAIVHIVKNSLEKRGFSVISADNAVEGLELLEKVSPDLILLDFWLPDGVNGLEVAREIRRDASFDNIPIIAVTAQGGPNAQRDAAEAGCNSYITKPFHIQDLIDEINEFLT